MGERLKQTPIERKNPRNIDFVETHLKGVYLKVVKGETVRMDEETIELYHRLGDVFAPASHAESDLKNQNKVVSASLKEIAKRFKHFRGMVSEEDAWDITATRSTKEVPVREVLRENLGIAYHSYVSEDYEAKINVPHGTLTADGEPIEAETIQNAFVAALRKIGLSDVQIGEIVTDEIKLKVNKKALKKAEKDEEIRLSKDAFETSTPTFGIKSEIIT